MPTTALTFADDEIDIRWKEPFLSDGLNEKLANIVPRGIYRGFRLSTSGVNRTVSCVADSVANDHVAVYETASNYALTIRRQGTFNIDLSSASYNSATVVIAIYAVYSIGVNTVAYVNVYTLAEYTALPTSQRNELVVLGTVAVPAGSSLISSSSITPDRRTTVFENMAPETPLWNPVLRNGSFEEGPVGITTPQPFNTPNWNLGTMEGGTVQYLSLASGASSRSGVGKALVLNSLSAGVLGGGGPVQVVHVPVTPGQYIKMRAWVKVLIAASSGTCALRAQYINSTGSTAGSTDLAIAINATDTSYRLVEGTFAVPTNATVLTMVSLMFTGTAFASNGAAVLFDDIQIWVETNGPLTAFPVLDARAREVSALPLVLEDINTPHLSALSGAMVSFDAVSNKVTLERRDQSATATPPDLALKGAVTELGTNNLGSATEAATARVLAPIFASSYTLLWESQALNSSSSPATRIYATNTPALAIVTNAKWDGTSTWTKEDNSAAATMWLASKDRLSFRQMPAAGQGGTLTFTDSQWTSSPGVVPFDVQGRTGSSGTNLVASLIGRLTNLGSGLVGSDTDAVLARVQNPVRTAGLGTDQIKFTLLLQTDGREYKVRHYHRSSDNSGAGTGDDSLITTVNAFYDNATGLWASDNSLYDSLYLQTSLGTVSVLRQTATASTWSGWSNSPLIMLPAAKLNALGGNLTLGTALNTTAAEARTARIAATRVSSATSDKTLLMQFNGSASTGHFRVYYSTDSYGASECLEITRNASWDGTNWSRDFSSARASKLHLSNLQLRFEVRNGAGTWTDSGWADDATNSAGLVLGGATTPQLLQLKNGVIQLTASQTGAGSTNPGPTDTPLANAIYAKSVVKAWAAISISGGAYTILDGLNVASVVQNVLYARVTFVTAMANSNYAVVMTSGNNALPLFKVLNKSTTTIDLSRYDATDVAQDISTQDGQYFIAVYARQDS